MMQKLLYEQNEYLPAFLQLFHFPQFDFNLWVIQLCGVVSQLALSDPPAWVQTSHLCPLTRQAPRCTTCPLSWSAATPPPPLQLPMSLLSYTWLSRNFPWVIISLLILIFSPGVGFAYSCFRRSWTWNLISWLCFGFRLPLETVPEELPLNCHSLLKVQSRSHSAQQHLIFRPDGWSSRKSDEGHLSFSQYTLQKYSHWLQWP